MNDTDVGRKGRPYGGCMIIYKSDMNLPVRQVQTSNNRLCAVVIETHNVNCMCIYAY